MSPLQEKSDVLRMTAGVLHQKGMYPAVAHSAYYSCLQICKHLWLYPMCKTQEDLDMACITDKKGTHGVLINATRDYIRSSGINGCSFDSRDFKNKIGQLKILRVEADYSDIGIFETDSINAISLSKEIHPILEKYL